MAGAQRHTVKLVMKRLKATQGRVREEAKPLKPAAAKGKVRLVVDRQSRKACLHEGKSSAAEGPVPWLCGTADCWNCSARCIVNNAWALQKRAAKSEVRASCGELQIAQLWLLRRWCHPLEPMAPVACRAH